MIKLGQILKKISLRRGKEVVIRVVKKNDCRQLLDFINSIIKEDDFIIKTKKLTFKEEKQWLKKEIKDILENKGILICALVDSKIVGTCSIFKEEGRLSHIGKLGISIRKEYGGEGIGSVLMKEALELAKQLGIKIVCLSVFETNKIALNFYKKFGFKIYGRLPKGVLRRGKYIASIYMYKELK